MGAVPVELWHIVSIYSDSPYSGCLAGVVAMCYDWFSMGSPKDCCRVQSTGKEFRCLGKLLVESPVYGD